MKMLRECCCKCCCCRCCVCCSDLFTCTDAVVAATVDDGKKSKNRLVAFRIFILKQWENLLLKMIFQNSVSFRIMLLRTMMKIAFRIMSHYRVVRGIMSFTAISYIFMLFGIVLFGILWVYCGFYRHNCTDLWKFLEQAMDNIQTKDSLYILADTVNIVVPSVSSPTSPPPHPSCPPLSNPSPQLWFPRRDCLPSPGTFPNNFRTDWIKFNCKSLELSDFSDKRTNLSK